MPSLEYRSFAELRQDADAGGFSGYASHFMTSDSYLTAMKRGAYRKTIAERGHKVPVLYSHNSEWNIGVPEVLREDKTGLYSEARLFDDGAEGTVTLKRLRQGARFGLSVGFQTVKDRAATNEDELDLSQVKGVKPTDIRIIEEVRLWEFSVVSFPANEAAVITDVRQRDELSALSTLLEDLRDGGLTPEDTRWTQLQALVAAYQERAEAGPPAGTTPLADEQARRTRNVEATLALVRAKGWIGAQV